MEPLISIIVPAYNMEEYIGRAIENLQNQTYKNLEIFIVNDGSTDATETICRRYQSSDPRIRLINKQNEGPAAARETGYLNASGDYIGFLDADDTIEPDMYQFLLEAVLKYDADIAHCGYRMVFEDGTHKDYYGTNKLIVQNHQKGLLDLLEAKNVEPSLCNKLYARCLFDNIKNETVFSINEDLMLNYLLFSSSNKAVFIDTCKYYYNKHSGSNSRSFSVRHFTDPVGVKETIVKYSVNESVEVQALAKRRLLSQYIMNCFSIRANRLKAYQEIYKDNLSKTKKLQKESGIVQALTRNDRIKMYLLLYTPWMCHLAESVYRHS